MVCFESTNYPWYGTIGEDQPINQGDILKNCPIIIPPKEIKDDDIDVDIEVYDLIVMSQSCDLANNKIKFVLTCPVYKLDEFIGRNSFYADKKRSLRQGSVVHYPMINECTLTDFECEHLIVDFKRVFSIDYKFLKNFVKSNGTRVCLLPPYREWLSQMFARSFMRVGLPIDISPFDDEEEEILEKIFKNAGAENVNEDVIEILQESLMGIAEDIAKESVNLANSDGRNSVEESDVENVIREHFG